MFSLRFLRDSYLKLSRVVSLLCSHAFILFRLGKTSVNVKIYQLCFRVFLCAFHPESTSQFFLRVSSSYSYFCVICTYSFPFHMFYNVQKFKIRLFYNTLNFISLAMLSERSELRNSSCWRCLLFPFLLPLDAKFLFRILFSNSFSPCSSLRSWPC